MKINLLAILAIVLVCSCKNETSIQIDSDRPIDTWVFRSVLDQNPRMLTAALNKNLYVAYFTETGTLYKAWKGIVNLEGAVYDGAHGPQPTTVGDAYLIQEKDRLTWELIANNQQQDITYNYLGHRFVKGSLQLIHGLKLKAGRTIKVFEGVEAITSESGQLYFKRDFSVEGLQADEIVRFHSSATVVDKSQIKATSNLSIVGDPKGINFNDAKYNDYSFVLNLDKENMKNELSIPLSRAMYPDPNIEDGFGEDLAALPEGAIAISKHDCKTCHNKNKKTVGPAYIDIAKKYEHTDENILMLANKIKSGGSGMWGDQVMTPHPEVSDYDLKQMVSYIFTLSKFDGESTKADDDNVQTFLPAKIETSDLIPGAVTAIYNIKSGIPSFPKNIGSLKPIQAGIMPNFDNLSGTDFKTLEKDFALVSTGYLEIDTDGIYEFRLWSDDGSLLYLHDQKVLNHDGLHGTSMKQVKLNLKKGYHPFKIEFFQGGGGQFLSWNYKPENDDVWKVVPTEMITHHKNEQEVIGDLTLPMSIITKIPGDGFAVNGVHPSFDLFQARPNTFRGKIGGMDFLPDGRLIVSNWDPEGGIYILDNVSSKNPDEIKVKRIAFGLAEPLGVKAVGDRLFVMQKQEITELIDYDGDDIIDEYRTLCDDWGVSANFHEFGFGLEEKDGFLYANLATGIQPGGAGVVSQHKNRGNCIKVSIEDGSIEYVASGLRTPNGIGIGYNDELFIADNQGDWLPSSKILHVSKGAWFGSRAVDFEGTEGLIEKKPVVWLPQDEIGNSPSTPSYINLGPYKNQMIHGEVTHGGIKRVFVEEVEGELQGAVFRFTQGLEAGVNRITWGPNGELYAGGIGNPGNWQHTGRKWHGLQKLIFNEKSTFEMLSVSARSNGVEIEFTEPLKRGDGWEKSDYEIRQWYYKPTKEYGGPKLDDRRLNIRSVNISDDRKKVFLELGGMKADHVLYVHLKNNFVSENEHSLWSTEAWYTMNAIPKDKPGFKKQKGFASRANTLTPYEKEQGWKLLFDGKSLENFHIYNSSDSDSKWEIGDEAIKFNSKADRPGGDLVTNDTYENFELNLEWRISNCGNSGIFFNVQESDTLCCTWKTGPEMQILDNTCHPDTRFVTHRAGDLYDMIACNYTTVKPAGQWNKVRIVSQSGEVEFWLNGFKVVDFNMGDENWTKMISESKFNNENSFGKYNSGHIALQDHGDDVWFRNIKIKNLK